VRRRDVVLTDRAVLRQRSLRRVPRRLELPEHRAALQEWQLRILAIYVEGGRRDRRCGRLDRRVLSVCCSLCLVQQSAQRHSTMKVPSPAGLRESRHPNFGLISV
jgi:hypothetical protein